MHKKSTKYFINKALLLTFVFFTSQLVNTLPSFAVQFKTNKQPQMHGNAIETNKGWKVTPLITIGDTNEGGQDINKKHLGYRPPGKLDGIGAFMINDNTVRTLVNHELRSNSGYVYKLANGTELKGSRVSFFDIDRKTLKVTAAGIAFDTVFDRTGKEVTNAAQIRGGDLNSIGGFAFLCSAYSINAGKYGFSDNIFFTGEEVGGGTGGQEAVLDVDNKDLYVVPMLGRAAFENVCPIETDSNDKVALLISDDRNRASLLLYIGKKGARPSDFFDDPAYNPPDFLVRNGLGFGNLYVFVSDDGQRNPLQFFGTSQTMNGKFIKIEHYNSMLAGTNGYDSIGFANLGIIDSKSDDIDSFMFSKSEDVSINPANGTQAVLATTGSSSFSNNWGTTYLIDIDFGNILDSPFMDINNIQAKIKILYDGEDAGNGQFIHPDFGLRNPDNLDWADDGFIYIQEDKAFGSFGQISGIESSIWQMNPINGQLARILAMDRSAIPLDQTDPDFNVGTWESSGILDVSKLFETIVESTEKNKNKNKDDNSSDDKSNDDDSSDDDSSDDDSDSDDKNKSKKKDNSKNKSEKNNDNNKDKSINKVQVFIFDVQAHSLKGFPLGNLDNDLVLAGSLWKYLDNGTDQGTAWKEPSFDDSSWSLGAAELGYGDGDETTVIDFGPDSNNKFITTYFRHSFNVTDITSINNLILRVLNDDGTVVYLNGTEIYRDNMPTGEIKFDTLASVGVGGNNEKIFHSSNVDASLLTENINVLAVEIHQINGSSSDISFDLSLKNDTEADLVEGGQLILMTKKK